MTWLFKQLIREQLGEMNIDTKNDILYQTPKQVEPEIVVENIGDPSSSFIYVYGRWKTDLLLFYLSTQFNSTNNNTN